VRRDPRERSRGAVERAVDEQVGKAHRQRLQGAITAAAQVGQQRGADVVQTRLRVAHVGWRVVVDRAEAPLPIDEPVARREVLRHPHELVVDRGLGV